MSDNLTLWERVQKTDPAATKEYKGAGGFEGTAVNATYLTRLATEIFGPVGLGWGYDIVSEQIIDGAPIVHIDGTACTVIGHEKIHTLRLRLWYMTDGKRAEVEHFGHTDVVYKNKYGVQTEKEPSKKSLTDAMKKCLSMLGFAADIFMGEFDSPAYVEQVRTEFDIEKAENREAEVEAKRAALTEEIKGNLATLKKAQTMGEVSGIAKAVLRHLDRQSKIHELKSIAEHGIRAINAEYETKKQELKA